MLHYLRIAVTALSLTACVLLIALWVRSYDTYYDLFGHLGKTRLLAISSFAGYIGVETSVWQSLPPPYTDYEPWHVNSLSVSDEGDTWFLADDSTRCWQFYLANGPNRASGVTTPRWFVASLAAVIALAPWLPWSPRFSLRTLLIAMTLAAVALALIVLL